MRYGAVCNFTSLMSHFAFRINRNVNNVWCCFILRWLIVWFFAWVLAYFFISRMCTFEREDVFWRERRCVCLAAIVTRDRADRPRSVRSHQGRAHLVKKDSVWRAHVLTLRFARNALNCWNRLTHVILFSRHQVSISVHFWQYFSCRMFFSSSWTELWKGSHNPTCWFLADPWFQLRPQACA